MVFSLKKNDSVTPRNDYREALDYLFARTTGETRLGLERTEKLLEVLGNPHDALKVFHIAGTNGKGSVSAIIERLLRSMGMRVGKYTSPHLVDFRERILIDGQMLDENAVTGFINRWIPQIEQIGATFFEATTAMALDAFARAEVDVVVLETGLGGRLDATNVVVPCVATVTNVGMDHTEFLGKSIAEIAAEKAGIFKRGIPAVIGERSEDVQVLLHEHARQRGASRVNIVARDFPVQNVSPHEQGIAFDLSFEAKQLTVNIGLRGRHQVWNCCTAIASICAAGKRFTPRAHHLTALGNLELPGRCQLVGDIVFDVAHNPDGMRVLAAALSEHFGNERFEVLLCVMSDKDWRGMLTMLGSVAKHITLTHAPTAPASRRWDLNEVGKFAAGIRLPVTVERDFERALAASINAFGRKLITGSFHTVGDAMSRLQVSPLPR